MVSKILTAPAPRCCWLLWCGTSSCGELTNPGAALQFCSHALLQSEAIAARAKQSWGNIPSLAGPARRGQEPLVPVAGSGGFSWNRL